LNDSLQQHTIKAASKIALDNRSKALRRLVVQALDGGGRGHIGSSMSLIEILRILYDDVLTYRAHEPNWDGRDRFILSKGHGCLAQYVLLADKGFFDVAELEKFCRAGSFLGGHPEAAKVPGVEASTGALGHGLPIAVGMALAARIKGVKNRVFVVTGDGEMDEGSNWEAMMSAVKHKLDNLVLAIDYNKIQSYGPTSEVLDLEPLMDKLTAFGFSTLQINGHDKIAIRSAFNNLPKAPGKPTAVLCHTIKGKGISFAEGDPTWHHKSRVAPNVIAAMYEELSHA